MREKKERKGLAGENRGFYTLVLLSADYLTLPVVVVV